MSPTEEPELLWQLFQRGDWEAYTKLYNININLLINYGHKFTRDRSLIEDAVHDLFIKLWTNRASLGTPLSVKNYLYKALRSILFRKLDHRSRFTQLVAGDALAFEVSFDEVVIASEEEQALQAKIKFAVGTLPPRQQEIVFLRFYEGFSYPEIADIMEITVSSAYKLLYKALHSIESAFAASNPGRGPGQPAAG
ncbi:RNA polymerase sigma factor [Hymenobacter coccineus]|uniref:RNA polymerase n=1 Tax=Hymenobacter coccineus TaxID=1908235 RepID=A0A1G1SYJ8_9BACT|nr:sigma-70 family RNA polymerase sigma factor [Hymenobacter coccineus]OGX83697.1 RNA polymerase [Hymenobacter coccineus]